MKNPTEKRSKRSWLRLLLLIPFVVLLWPTLYNFSEPTFIGIPFFYWFQLLWVILTGLLTAFVYFVKA